MHISRGENEKNNTFTGLLTGARQRWGGKKKKKHPKWSHPSCSGETRLCSSLTPSHWRCQSCAMWMTSWKHRSTPASCTAFFMGCLLFLLLTCTYWRFSGVHYCSSLPLFHWHSSFSRFLPSVFSIYYFCLLCFHVVSELFFQLPLLTFLSDS